MPCDCGAPPETPSGLCPDCRRVAERDWSLAAAITLLLQLGYRLKDPDGNEVEP